MPADAEMVNVFRSADEDAEEDAKAIHELLKEQGILAVLLDDSSPGVPSGAWEVQVPVAESQMAEELITEARLPEEDLVEVDGSSTLDTETVFSGSSENEAMSVKNLLESSGIAAILVGDSVLPNLPFGVQVAKDRAEECRTLIAQAEVIGPEAAEAEERAGEAAMNP